MAMFNLLLSTDGYIHRIRFLVGNIALVVLSILVIFAYFYIMPNLASHFGVTSAEFSASFQDILKALNDDTAPMPAWSKSAGLIYITGTFFICLFFWANICLTIKRLRDLDVSLWFALIPMGVFTYIIEIVMLMTKSLSDQNLIQLSNIVGIVQLISIIILTLYPSRLNISPLDEDDDEDYD